MQTTIEFDFAQSAHGFQIARLDASGVDALQAEHVVGEGFALSLARRNRAARYKVFLQTTWRALGIEHNALKLKRASATEAERCRFDYEVTHLPNTADASYFFLDIRTLNDTSAVAQGNVFPAITPPLGPGVMNAQDSDRDIAPSHVDPDSEVIISMNMYVTSSSRDLVREVLKGIRLVVADV